MKLLSIIFILVFSFSAFGQNKKPLPKPIPTKETPTPSPSPKPTPTKEELSKQLSKIIEPEYSDNAFEVGKLNLEKLPPNYMGNDFTKVFSSLVENFKSKDEFETTEAFEQRTASAIEKILFGNIKPFSILSFRYDSIESQYNADTQILSVFIKVRPLYSVENIIKGEATNIRAIQVKSSVIKELGTYEGQNAYGAKITIAKSEDYQFTLAINNVRDFRSYLSAKTDRFAPPDTNLEINLNLPPAEAKAAKVNLSCLFIFSPKKPFVGVDFQQLSPKFDFPHDVKIYNSYLQGRLIGIWLFNRSTGGIYKKIEPEPITASRLRIDSIVRDNYLLLLDKSLIDVLVESGVAPVDRTGRGITLDLLVSYIKGNKIPDSKKYKPFMDSVIPAIKKHVVQTISTDAIGKATISNLKFGNYYIFGGWSDYSGTYVWDIPVHIEGEETLISLSSTNATYK